MENNTKIDRELAKKAKKIEDIKGQIAELTRKLREEEIAYGAQLDIVKLLNRPASVSRQKGLRPNTDLAKIHQFLMNLNNPVHISEIAKFLGKEDTSAVRASLAGSLGSYAREKRIFSKISPNTFGLIEKSYAEDFNEVTE